jgi:putative heme transporter
VTADQAGEREAPVLTPKVRIPAFWIGFVGMLGAGLAWALLSSVNSISTVLTYVGLALFLALGLEPIILWLVRKRIARPWAVTIVVLVGLLVVSGVVLLILPTVIRQVQDFVAELPDIVARVALSGWARELEDQFVGVIDIDALFDSAVAWVSNPANLVSVGGGIVAVGAGIAGFATGALIVGILTIYFAATLPGIKAAAYSLVPASRRPRVRSVTEEVTRSVGRYVLGQASLGAINGVLSFTFLTIIGAPLPALLAFVAFLGSLIPLVGTISASIVIVLACLAASPGLAVVVGVYYLIYMQVEAYLFSPRIMNAAVNIPGSLVIIAAVTGGTLGGVLGAVVSVPLAASILIIVRRVVIPQQAGR